MSLQCRIRESSHGGVDAEYGADHQGGCHIPGILGATMPAFIVYESCHFDTRRQAEAFVRRKGGKKR